MNRTTHYWLIMILGPTSLPAYQLGIESIGHTLDAYKTKRIGLVTNQTGVTQSGKRTIEVLRKKQFNLVALFAPEHGLDGTVTAGKQVTNSIDQKSKLPIISLYTGEAAAAIIAKNILDTLDAIFFDIQDAGMRHYTYISTLYALLQTCADAQKPLVVFDRPNPLGGVMEGPLVDEQHHSFISIAPIPLRHGMTIGELAQYFNHKLLAHAAPLQVIAMKGYTRNEQINHLATALSPRIPNIHACRGYSFLGLLGEVEPFNYNGTIDTPFQSILLSKKHPLYNKHWRTLQYLLTRDGVTCKRAVSTKTLAGLNIRIAHINHYSAFNTLLDLLTFMRSHVPLTFKPAFDTAAGTHNIQAYVQGEINRSQLAHVINDDLKKFYTTARDYWLYKPYPRIVLTRDH